MSPRLRVGARHLRVRRLPLKVRRERRREERLIQWRPLLLGRVVQRPVVLVTRVQRNRPCLPLLTLPVLAQLDVEFGFELAVLGQERVDFGTLVVELRVLAQRRLKLRIVVEGGRCLGQGSRIHSMLGRAIRQSNMEDEQCGVRCLYSEPRACERPNVSLAVCKPTPSEFFL